MIHSISSTQVLIRAPAKVNLFLHVLGRRLDGYHELDSLMIPIDLHDRLLVATHPSRITVRCLGHADLEGRKNLCYRAAERYLEEIGWPIGANIEITKKIPLAGGLGGGSSDAAATLLALQYIMGNPLSFSRLLHLASSLGADVPFFLMRCPCLAQGIGEKLTPVLELPRLWFIVACAPFGLSTQMIFQDYDNSSDLSSNSLKDNNRFFRQEQTEAYFPSPTEETFKTLKISLTSDSSDDRHGPAGCEFRKLVSHMKNDLQPISERRHPEIATMCDELLRAGAAGASMSGSGPTVFGVFRTREEARRASRCVGLKGWKYLMAKGITSAGRTTE